jgi:hypothetical protein
MQETLFNLKLTSKQVCGLTVAVAAVFPWPGRASCACHGFAGWSANTAARGVRVSQLVRSSKKCEKNASMMRKKVEQVRRGPRCLRRGVARPGLWGAWVRRRSRRETLTAPRFTPA